MRASARVCVPCVHICVCVRVEEVGGSDGVCGGGGGGGGGWTMGRDATLSLSPDDRMKLNLSVGEKVSRTK